MHRDKLINHLYKCFVNDFGVMRDNTAIVTKAIYFPDSVGFSDWINRLHKAGVLNRVKYRKCSKYTLGHNGVKYLNMIYQEMIANDSKPIYRHNVSLDSQGIEGKEMDKLQTEISEMNERLNLIVSMLTPEQKLEIPKRHLKLVDDEEEKIGY